MKITLAMCLLLGVGYVLVLRGVSALAGPNGGQAETLTLDGRVVGAANVGQQFTGGRYFWGRPSAVDYNGGGSGGSNKATTNPEYLADVEQRVQDFLAAHPERIKEIQRQCKEDRAKVGDELCRRAAEAANRRFFGDRPEQKSK